MLPSAIKLHGDADFALMVFIKDPTTKTPEAEDKEWSI